MPSSPPPPQRKVYVIGQEENIPAIEVDKPATFLKSVHPQTQNRLFFFFASSVYLRHDLRITRHHLTNDLQKIQTTVRQW